MKINSLHIENFRSFQKREFYFSPFYNIIVGKNGAGKTTLLESIYILSTGKSFVTNHLLNCIRFNEHYSFISLNFQDSSSQKSIDFLMQEKKKEIKFNGKKVKSFAEIIGILPTIFLNYKVVNIIKGGPDERRNFLNHLLIFTDAEYYKDLLNYYSILQKRNMLLKGIRISEDLLSVLTEQMIPLGKAIQEKRKKTIILLSEIIQRYIVKISNENLNIKLIYKPLNIERLAQEGIRKMEIEKKHTLFGPHLDELEILVNGIPIREFSSLGEAYSFAFALRFAEKEFINKKRGEEPVLLLDDFFSDLDELHRENVLKMMKDEQIFLTALNLNVIPKNVINKAKVIVL